MITKKLSQVVTPIAVPNFVQIPTRRASRQIRWIYYNQFLCIYSIIPYFWGTHLHVRPVGGFSLWMAQTTRTRALMCLFGVSLILLPI